MAIYRLTLHKTYYDKGFFNVGVGYDRYVRRTSGPVRLRLGRDGSEIPGKVDRNANRNGTPRVFGGVALSRWFQANFKPMDVVAIDLSDLECIVLNPKE